MDLTVGGVKGAELLARNGDFAVLAVAQPHTFGGRANENFAVLKVVQTHLGGEKHPDESVKKAMDQHRSTGQHNNSLLVPISVPKSTQMALLKDQFDLVGVIRKDDRAAFAVRNIEGLAVDLAWVPNNGFTFLVRNVEPVAEHLSSGRELSAVWRLEHLRLVGLHQKR